ncbi:MAG TPA: class F sortase [Patescibacteria group bacterium]
MTKSKLINKWLIIPKINVRAKITVKRIGSTGIMPSPGNPDDVLFYDFAKWPKLGGIPGKFGNSIISGHVDSGFKPCKGGTVPPPCEAVFWDIDKLKAGDTIQIKTPIRNLTYKVTSNIEIPADSIRWSRLLASTRKQTVTLITCNGRFNTKNRQYSHRQAVRAILI